MSFILDALKKSEADRQQQSSAEFSHVPTSSTTTPVPRWVWISGLLLAINLAVLTGLLLKPASDPIQAATPVASAQDTPPVVTPPVPTSFEQRVAAAQREPAQQQRQPIEPIATPSETQLNRVEPILIASDPSSVSAAELYPSVQEVRSSGLINLPELHLDIHVFGNEPKDRFVFINMTKLREGSQLEEGPVVVEITPEGVVLKHQGQQFLLTRN